jgi:hypothetical protein
MKSEHANYRKVLASFLKEIPENKGWWYRLPLASISSKDGKQIPTDVILPHLGTAFGLSEQAMLLFLVEMGTYQAKGEGHLDRAKKAGLEKIDKQELKAVCSAHGQTLQLLDGMFSLLNTKRGAVTAEIVEKLKERLELARKKWDDMGLSMTPKWHMLLAHAVEMLLRTGGGLIEMGEDRIERAHQLRERDRQRYSRLRNIQMMKASQAKFQNLRMDPTIKSVQAEVQSKARRNLKRGRSLKEENDDTKRVARNEERVTVFDEVAAQDRIALPQARAGKSRKLRDHLKR